MTNTMKFYKELERYGLVKDSQFMLNIPLELLSEIIEKCEKDEKAQVPREEISDEEISDESDCYEFGSSIAFEEGAKWYREQLKQPKKY
jgi:hypothetical protein